MATLGKSTLAALNLIRASFELRHDGQFWYATYKARPGRDWILIEDSRNTEQAAVDALERNVIRALEPGGSLARYVR